jgi:taurine transport system ATP-binding protein
VSPQVSLRGVSHRFATRGAGVDALGPLDLDIEAGEFVVLVGPSGCGKTTLLSLLAGFLAPTSGVVRVDGVEVLAPGPERGVVFQQPNLYPWLSVRENVALGPRLRGVDRRTRRRIADEQLARVGLAEFASAPPYTLSGGMQQRCQIARILANDPRIMLLDEPFGALDALTREQMQDELHRIWRGSGKTAVFITHSVEEAVYLGTRVVVMSPRPGRIVFDERSPVDGERTDELRAAPEFVAFRQRVRRWLGEREPQGRADLAHSPV